MFYFINILLFLQRFIKRISFVEILVFNLILFSSFYTISLFEVERITFHLKIPEYLAILLIIGFIIKLKTIDKKAFNYFLAIVFVLGVSLLVRFFDFEPVEVWELEDSMRESKFNKIRTKEGLSFTNITQMLYVVLGALVFVIFSSLKLEKTTIIKAIYAGLFIVNIIAVLQLLLYYTDNYNIYMHYFYSIDEKGKYAVTAFQNLFGFKRINSVQNEPSIYGYFSVCTFMILFLVNHKKTLFRKYVWYFSAFMLLISTSFTGYLGIAYFFVLRKFYLRKNIALIIWIIAITIVLIAISLLFDDLFGEIIQAKIGSFKERYRHGITMPFIALNKMPLFGLGIGTDKPSILIINILVSIGYLGFFILGVNLLMLINKKRALRFFLLLILLLGLTQNNFHYLFVWIYMGVLYNFEKEHKMI